MWSARACFVNVSAFDPARNSVSAHVHVIVLDSVIACVRDIVRAPARAPMFSFTITLPATFPTLQFRAILAISMPNVPRPHNPTAFKASPIACAIQPLYVRIAHRVSAARPV